MSDHQDGGKSAYDGPGTALVNVGGRLPSYGYSGPDRYMPQDVSGSELIRINLREYWRIVNKHKYLIIAVAAAFSLLGTFRTLTTTPTYTAVTRLQIDRASTKVVESGNTTPSEGGEQEFLKTQYELLQSRTIAERTASALKLADDLDFVAPHEFSLRAMLFGYAKPNVADRALRERAAASRVQAGRAVRPVPGSRLVELVFVDADAQRAQRIVMGLADAFIASSVDKRFEANAYAKTFLEDQLKQLQLKVQDSQQVLIAFGQKEQIIATTEKSSIAENNLASANAALGQLISDRIRNEQQYKQVENATAISLPQFLTNTVINGLRDRRNALVTDYQEKLETFKPDYPVMVQLNNKIREIDRQLAAEVKTIKGSLKGAYAASRTQEEEMRKQIDGLRAEVLDLQKRSIEYNILKRDAETNQRLYDSLLQRYREVDIAGGVGANNIFIIDRAETPGAPSAPLVLRSIMLSVLLGVGAGLASAFVLERLDDTVGSIEEVERVSGLATLGVIPKMKNTGETQAQLFDPRSPLSEAYRSLATSLHFATENGLPKTLLVTSAAPGEGKSTTSLAVTRHFAAMGLKVLLVDADLRKPSLHIKLGLSNALGLSNYLTGRCTPPETFQATDIANLTFMASGPLPPNAADLLSSARLVSLLTVGSEVFDLIVLDGPPVMGLADAQLLSSATAGTVFVLYSGVVRKATVRSALKRLHFARGFLVGTVLAQHNMKADGYGYGYAYGYGAGADRADEPALAAPAAAREKTA